MNEEILSALIQFHREYAMPDMERLIDAKLDARIGPVLSSLDSLAKGFNRLETEYYALVEAVRRIEGRLTSIEGRLTSIEERLTRVEGAVARLDAKVTRLDARVARLETELEDIRAELDDIKRKLVEGLSRSELEKLKERVRILEDRVTEIEAQR